MQVLSIVQNKIFTSTYVCTGQTSNFSKNASNFVAFSKPIFQKKSAKFANFGINFGEFLLEFCECFQKMENNIEICRNCCKIFLKFPKTNNPNHSIHFFQFTTYLGAGTRGPARPDPRRPQRSSNAPAAPPRWRCGP